MGVISKKLASRFRKAKKQLGDLRRQAAADFGQVPRDVKTVQALVRSAHDPLHAAYITVQNFTSFFAEAVSQFPEFDPTKGDWKGAFFFALAVAVGLTPEMLPMIVAVCLTKGALAMSRKKVIVKRLNSIQNLGAMDVLCTDKTGTLTMDRIILEKHCDVVLKEDEEVLTLAYLNSHFQTGLKNLMDRAILQHTEVHEHPAFPEYAKVDEIPFDFARRMMSVVVKTPANAHRLICKGAPEEVYKHCNSFALDGQIHPMDHVIPANLKAEFDQLSADGFRVLALAYRDQEPKAAYSKDDEKDLVLRGYVAFLDPPKDTARSAIAALQADGISVKVLTGDNELVSRKICREVGIATDQVLLGSQVEGMSDVELAAAATEATLFARLSPAHKQRVLKALQGAGHVVRQLEIRLVVGKME